MKTRHAWGLGLWILATIGFGSKLLNAAGVEPPDRSADWMQAPLGRWPFFIALWDVEASRQRPAAWCNLPRLDFESAARMSPALRQASASLPYPGEIPELFVSSKVTAKSQSVARKSASVPAADRPSAKLPVPTMTAPATPADRTSKPLPPKITLARTAASLPHFVESDERYRQLMQSLKEGSMDRRAVARALLVLARDQMAAQRFDQAETLLLKAMELAVTYRPGEETPETLLRKIPRHAKQPNLFIGLTAPGQQR